jgi:hypothetical protein
MEDIGDRHMEMQDYISHAERLRQLKLNKKYFLPFRFEPNKIPLPANGCLFKPPQGTSPNFNSSIGKSEHQYISLNHRIKPSKKLHLLKLKYQSEQSLLICDDKDKTLIGIKALSQIRISKDNLKNEGRNNNDD